MFKTYSKILFFVFLSILTIACKKNTLQLSATETKLPSNNNLQAICFLTDSIGFVAGGERWLETNFYKTTDAGLSWQAVNLNPYSGGSVMCIKKLSNGNVMAVGLSGLCYISQDSGATWSFTQIGDYGNYVGIASNNNTIFLSNEFGTIFNYNYAMQQQHKNTFNIGTHKLQMVDANNGFVASNTTILKTTDAGNTWQFTDAKGDYFRDIVCTSINNCTAVGLNGSIINSKDAGKTWQEVKAENKAFAKGDFLNAICTIPNTNNLIAVGDKGLVVKINTANNTYQLIENFTTKHLNDVCVLNNNTVIIAASQGLVFKLNL